MDGMGYKTTWISFTPAMSGFNPFVLLNGGPQMNMSDFFSLEVQGLDR